MARDGTRSAVEPAAPRGSPYRVHAERVAKSSRPPTASTARIAYPSSNRSGRISLSAARSVLAEMRSAGHDPAQTGEAKAKRVASYKDRKADARVWEKQNPGPHDPVMYRTEILPRLPEVTVPQMMRATGLTSGYCWKIRRGERTPHPMYWLALRRLVEGT
jgi:hypothetical protein